MRKLAVGTLALVVAFGVTVARADEERREGKEGDFKKATVVKVDEERNTLTLRCEVKGKEETKTFSLKDKDIRVLNERGRPAPVAALKRLRPGQEVRVKMEGDKLKEVKLSRKDPKDPGR